MGEWVDIPAFVDDEIRRVDTFQQIWHNLYHLKNPMYTEINFPGPYGAEFTTTTTGVWANIDTDTLTIAFESAGNDLLIWTQFSTEHSAANGAMFFTFMLDGVRLGNTRGLLGHQDTSGRETPNLACIAEGVEAGSHSISIQWWNGTTGTAEIEKYPTLRLWVMEF